MNAKAVNLWTSSEHAKDYLQRADVISHRAEAVAVDFSPTMLEAARKRFAGDQSVAVVEHNMDAPLPSFGKFDAVISSFAIHHLTHQRKRALYEEVYAMLNTGRSVLQS